MKFILDANVFIEPANFYYDLEIVPGYWKSLQKAHDHAFVHSIDKVRDELLVQKNQLAIWVKTLPKSFFDSSSDTAVTSKFSDVITWVYGHRVFSMAAKQDFANGADGWLVAYAAVNSATIVTQEVLKPDDTKRHVSIPNVCVEFSVKYINVYEFVRELGNSCLALRLDC